jgi:(S)-mandelate dehydrogenase
MPFKPTWRLFHDCISRPAWSLQQCKAIKRLTFPILNSGSLIATQESKLFSRSFDNTITWKDIAEIRNHWRGTLVLKGILHPEDALQAHKIGVDGIVVSNHGGRQLASAPASLEMLPFIVAAVKNKLTILIDGGIRTGEDILKSVALGADGVLIGRLPLYGLAADGGNGVSEVLSMLQKEMCTAMSLTGCSTIDDVKNIRVINRRPGMEEPGTHFCSGC